MDFKEILDVYQNNGIAVTILIFFVVIVVIPIFKQIRYQSKVNNVAYKRALLGHKTNKKNEDIDDCQQIDRPIGEHPFFISILDMIRKTPYSIDFGGLVRTKMFSDMFITKSNIVFSRMKQFIELDFKDDIDWYNALTQIILDITYEYELSWIKAGVPDIAIQRFNVWHSKRVELIKSEIKSIYEMKGCDNYEKTYAVLDLLMFIMRMTLVDLSKAAWELNGSLTGKTYKGQIIEDLKH